MEQFNIVYLKELLRSLRLCKVKDYYLIGQVESRLNRALQGSKLGKQDLYRIETQVEEYLKKAA